MRRLLQTTPYTTFDSNSRLAKPRTLHADLKHLDGSETTNQTEEALRSLEQCLGLNSAGPEKAFETGPDVLWLLEGGQAMCMDAKTEIEEASKYSEKDIRQMYNYIQ